MRTGRAALLGRPVAHSHSPILHRTAYAALGLDWTYEAIDCDEAMLPGVLAASGPEVVGYSCTMPLKRAALTLASDTGAEAQVVGAANTLRPLGGGWRADNTDVTGISAALAEGGARPGPVTVLGADGTQGRVTLPGAGGTHGRVTLLGAGGTAQAAVVALAQRGVHECAVLVRNAAHTDELTATAARVGVALQVDSLSISAQELAADLVISALPPGAADLVAQAQHRWHSGQVVLDAVYDPWPTPLAAAAAEGGAVVVSGALMLLHQAAAQVELMTGLSAPLPAMRDALRKACPGGGV